MPWVNGLVPQDGVQARDVSAMVDIHSRILPGLDVGPEDFEVSLEMLRMARQANTTDIVATPHASPSYRYDPELISDLIGKLK